MKKKVMFIIFLLVLSLISNKSIGISNENITKIYFLSEINNARYEKTGEWYADCILLENYDVQTGKKKFALIDTGTSGTQNEMLKFLKDKGVDKLDFVLITHCHSDHAGAIKALLNNVKVDTLYIKEVDKVYVNSFENVFQSNYDTALKLCAQKGIRIIGPSIFYGPSTTISEKERLYDNTYVTPFNDRNTNFKFGSANIQIINWEIQYDEQGNRIITEGENENSLGVLVTQGNKKAFLAGDINNLDGDEERLGKLIGKIDFLKLGHHGFGGSTTNKFLNYLSPKYALITNSYIRANQTILERLKNLNIEYHFSTEDETAVIAIITDNDVSIKYEHANCEKYISGEMKYVADIWKPELNVTYSTKKTTNTYVEVSINSNEELRSVRGWTLSNDKLKLTKKYIENATEIVTVRDLAGNESTAYIEVSNIKNSDEFKINKLENTYTLTGVDYKNNTVNRFLQMADFDGIYDINLYDNNQEIINDDKISTGTTLRLYNEENNIYQDYTIVIYGDTNGDGRLTALDALYIIKNKLGEKKFSDEIYKEAGRITELTRNQKTEPVAIDALSVIEAKLGKYEIKQ